jgi:hypothetical protein
MVAAAALWERRSRLAAKVGLAWLLVPVGCLAVFPLRGHLYEPKHLSFASPALALLVAAGFAVGRRWVSLTAAMAALVLLGLNAVSVGHYFRPDVEKENWRGLVTHIANEVRPADVVIFNPPYVRLPFQYYYKTLGQARQLPRLIPVDAPPAGRPFRLDERLRGRRVWLISAVSNVAIPNPQVSRTLQAYFLASQHYGDAMVGLICASLYDTSRPSEP